MVVQPISGAEELAKCADGGVTVDVAAAEAAAATVLSTLPTEASASAGTTHEAARKLFSGPIAFLKSAPSLDYLPAADVPEVAFAGRSNVGKSSLLNALTNRNGLARTSNTPGRTQELNFFDVGDPRLLRLVDMPGYGFAEAPKDVVRKWRFLINDYLRGRQVLKRAFVLIDSRHGIKAVDTEVMDMLDAAAVSYIVVLTKADKVKATALAEVVAATEAGVRTRPAAHPVVIATSSEGGMGIPELRAAVLEAASL